MLHTYLYFFFSTGVVLPWLRSDLLAACFYCDKQVQASQKRGRQTKPRQTRQQQAKKNGCGSDKAVCSGRVVAVFVLVMRMVGAVEVVVVVVEVVAAVVLVHSDVAVVVAVTAVANAAMAVVVIVAVVQWKW